MAGNTDILRQYLVSLGYKIDNDSADKAAKHLNLMDGLMLGLGNRILDVGQQLLTFVNRTAEGAIKMGILAERTRSPVSQLKALQYALEQAGFEANTLDGALAGFSQRLKQPGFQQLVNSILGKDASKETPVQQMLDLLEKLRTMNPAQSQTIWEKFGFDAQTMQVIGDHIGELRKNINSFLDDNKKIDDQNAVLDRYGKSWRKLSNEVSQAGFEIAAAWAPLFEWTAEQLTGQISDMRKTHDDPNSVKNHASAGGVWGAGMGALSDVLSDLMLYAGGGAGRQVLTDPGLAQNKSFGGNATGGGAAGAPAAASGDPRRAKLAALEQKWNLPSGLLYGLWGQESNYGDPKYMDSNKDAHGHFQFTPATSKDYNLKDPYDFDQSSSAAAHKMSDLVKHYDGNITYALMAYNWGMTNMDNLLSGKADVLLPRETMAFPGGVAAHSSGPGPSVVQHNETKIEVHSTDPHAAGEAAANAQSRVHQDMTRHMSVPNVGS